MRSVCWVRFAFLSCVTLAVAALPATPALAGGDCMPLAGTIAGQFVIPEAPDMPGWYGQAYLSFGKGGDVLVARLVDLNDGYKNHPTFRPDGSGNFAGYEILTFTVDGVGSFQVKAQFTCVGGATPFFCGFSETGKVVPEAGTGDYAGMTGNLSIHGSAVAGTFGGPSEAQPWLWIAQITGSVCMAQ